MRFWVRRVSTAAALGLVFWSVTGGDAGAGAAAPDRPPQALLRIPATEDAAVGQSFPSVRGLRFSPDGRYLAVRGEPSDPTQERFVLLFDSTTGKLVHRFPVGPLATTDCVFSADGKRLITAAAGDPQGVTVWELDPPRAVHRLEGGFGRVFVSPDGGRLAVASPFRSRDVVRVYDLATGAEVQRFVVETSYRMRFSPEGQRLLSTPRFGDRLLRLVDLKSAQTLRELTGCRRPPFATAISPDGRTIAAETGDGGILLWEYWTGHPIAELEADPRRVLALAFSADGRLLASGGTDRSVAVWDVATGKRLAGWSGHDGPVTAVTFTSDRQRVASGGLDRRVIVWNASGLTAALARPAPLTEQTTDRFWHLLASANPADAYPAIGQLVQHDDESIAWLAREVRTTLFPAENERIRRLIEQLDHDDYIVRYRATQELRKLLPVAKPILLKVIEETASAEVRARIRRILTGSKDAPRFSTADLRRLHRIIHVLEGIGGDEAQSVLKLLAENFPDKQVVRDAQESLERLARSKAR